VSPPPGISFSDRPIGAQAFFAMQGVVMRIAHLAAAQTETTPGWRLMVAFCGTGALAAVVAPLWRRGLRSGPSGDLGGAGVRPASRGGVRQRARRKTRIDGQRLV